MKANIAKDEAKNRQQRVITILDLRKDKSRSFSYFILMKLKILLSWLSVFLMKNEAKTGIKKKATKRLESIAIITFIAIGRKVFPSIPLKAKIGT